MTLENKNIFSSYFLNWNLEHVFPEEERDIILCQRATRRFLASKRMHGGDAASMIPRMEQWKEQGIARFPRTPLYSCAPSPEKADAVVKLELPAVAAHVRKFLGAPALRAIDFQSFTNAFQSCLRETLKFMMSFPPRDRGYVIIVDEPEKSNSWMVSLGLKLLSNHPPIDVVHKDDLTSALKNKQVRHLVLLDDASYSGKQMASTLDLQIFSSIERCSTLKAMHLVIPYLTNQAKDKILASVCDYAELNPIFKQSIFLISHKKMPLIGELPFLRMGISDQDLKYFIEFLNSKYTIDPQDAPLLALTCFDHKIADNLSTPDVLIKIVMGDVCPPYKREYDAVVDQFALSSPAEGWRDRLGLKEQFTFIQKRRRSYICPKFECEDLRIVRDEQDIFLKPLEMFELQSGDLLFSGGEKLTFNEGKRGS
jgi:hypothetical protein